MRLQCCSLVAFFHLYFSFGLMCIGTFALIISKSMTMPNNFNHRPKKFQFFSLRRFRCESMLCLQMGRFVLPLLLSKITTTTTTIPNGTVNKSHSIFIKRRIANNAERKRILQNLRWSVVVGSIYCIRGFPSKRIFYFHLRSFHFSGRLKGTESGIRNREREQERERERGQIQLQMRVLYIFRLVSFYNHSTDESYFPYFFFFFNTDRAAHNLDALSICGV